VRLWNVCTGEVDSQLPLLPGGLGAILPGPPAGSRLAGADNPQSGAKALLGTVASGTVPPPLTPPTETSAVLPRSPDGKALATVGSKLRIWDCVSESWSRVKETTDQHMVGVAWSPDGQWVAAATVDAIWVENARSGEVRWRGGPCLPGTYMYAPH